MSVPAAYLSIILIWSTTPLAIQWSSTGNGFLFPVMARMIIGLAICVLLLATRVHTLNWALAFFVLVSFTVNSTHSLLGPAAAMDIGGRKAAARSPDRKALTTAIVDRQKPSTAQPSKAISRPPKRG